MCLSHVRESLAYILSHVSTSNLDFLIVSLVFKEVSCRDRFGG